MEAVNRRHARFAGSKFKARYATGPHTIVGPSNWTRWRSSKAVSRSVERIGYQWKFSASYIRARFDESEFPRQNREWTRAGKHNRHNCTPAKNQVKPGTVQKWRSQCIARTVRVCINTIRLYASMYKRTSKIPLAEKLRRIKRRWWWWSMRNSWVFKRNEKVDLRNGSEPRWEIRNPAFGTI